MRTYRGHDADNARWEGVELREGDVVISSPSKSGTTWTQLLCALLIFDGPDFPAPLSDTSMWIDMRTTPVEEVRRVLAAQTHRRFVKTHTPLDGLPLDPRVTYLCVGRDPRDVAVSLSHHRANMDRDRLTELLDRTRRAEAQATGRDHEPGDPPAVDRPDPTGTGSGGVDLDRWIDAPAPEGGTGEPLAAVLHHHEVAWSMRHRPGVVLLHFADYVHDLPAELRRLAARLGIPIDGPRSEALAAEATLERARERAGHLAPNATQRLWRDPVRFFRSGRVGEWRERFSPEQLDRYRSRVADLVGPDVSAWVHGGRRAADPDAPSGSAADAASPVTPPDPGAPA